MSARMIKNFVDVSTRLRFVCIPTFFNILLGCLGGVEQSLKSNWIICWMPVPAKECTWFMMIKEIVRRRILGGWCIRDILAYQLKDAMIWKTLFLLLLLVDTQGTYWSQTEAAVCSLADDWFERLMDQRRQSTFFVAYETYASSRTD